MWSGGPDGAARGRCVCALHHCGTTVLRRPPVSEKQRAGRKVLLGHEPFEVPGEVPGPCGEVDHEAVVTGEPPEQLAHAGDRAAGVLAEEERVPCGAERSGQPGDKDRVVDVADDTARGAVVDHANSRRHRVVACYGHGDFVPAGREGRPDLTVHVPAAIGRERVLAPRTTTSTSTPAAGTVINERQPRGD